VDLELDDDQRFFHETAKRFLKSEVPIAEVRRLAEAATGFDREWWARGAALGWTSLMVREANGGGSLSGNGLGDLAIVGRSSAGPWRPARCSAATWSHRPWMPRRSAATSHTTTN